MRRAGHAGRITDLTAFTPAIKALSSRNVAIPPLGVHVGAREDDSDPIAEAVASGADAVQIFLADPQGWKAPKPSPRAAEFAATRLDIYVHAPYVLNVATSNNRIRIPSRKLLAAHAKAAAAIGAKGLIVHGGHVLPEDDEAVGFENWRKVFTRQAEDGGFGLPVLIENTAGGEKAMARRLEAIEKLWTAVGEFGAGFVLDTCHAWAGGIDLDGAVDAVRAITGRIDLVHCNNSRDNADSGRDRHAPLASGEIDTDTLIEIVRAAGAPVILETPGGAQQRGAEITLLREALA